MNRFRFTLAFLLSAGIALVFLGWSPAGDAHFKHRIIWEDRFIDAEKEMLTQWVEEVGQATAEVLGPYPFTVNIYMHRRNGGNEPVPWANTVRDGEQGVHFHVVMDYDLKDFQSDWTASHEISHLSIPHLGRENMWFAEGYASFMQWHILKHQGLFTEKEVKDKYNKRIEMAISKFKTDQPFPEACRQMLKRYDYPGVYWGGACYFFQVDALLKKEKGISLPEVIQRYQQNGRMEGHDLDELVAALDELSDSSIFSKRLKAFREESSREVIRATPTLH